MKLLLSSVLLLSSLHHCSACVGKVGKGTKAIPAKVADVPLVERANIQPEWGTAPNPGLRGCSYGAPLIEDDCVQRTEFPKYAKPAAAPIGHCPRPTIDLLPSELEEVSYADLRNCTEYDTRYFSFEQVEAVPESTIMEWSRYDSTKLATLVHTAEVDQIDDVEWEWTAKDIDADFINIMSPTAVSKTPFDRIIPYMHADEVALIDPAPLIAGVPDDRIDDVPWEMVGSAMTPEKMRSISPEVIATNEAVPWDRMLPYMNTRSVEAINQEQWQAMPPSAFEALDQRTFGTIGSDTLNEVTTYQLQSIRPDNWQGVSPRQVQAIEPEKFGELPGQSLKWIDPETIASMDSAAFNSMGPSKFASLYPKQLAAIDPGVVQEVDPSIFRQLTSKQAAAAGIREGQFIPAGLSESGVGFGNNRARRS